MKRVVLITVLLTSWMGVAKAQEAKARTEKVHVKVGSISAGQAATFAEWGITKLPKYRALIIGVSEYTHASAGLRNLEQPVNDAQKLYDVLTTHYTFDPADVILLKNPTRGQIVDSLEQLAFKVKPDENLLVFYAGHGIFDKKLDIGYWIPSDGEEGRKSTFLANSELRNYLKGITSKHTLLISDACFGGSIFAAGRSSYNAEEVGKFNDMYKGRSRKALTSGNFQEVPDRSIFMEYLIKALAENVKPFIAGTLLYTTIYGPISNNSRILPQYGAIQDAGDEGVANSFIFIRRGD
jgi:hypothetical protein